MEIRRLKDLLVSLMRNCYGKFLGYGAPEISEYGKNIGLARQKGEPVPYRYEVQYPASNGDVRWAEFAAGLIEYKGKPAGIVIALDITDRKQAEVSLMESKAQADLYVDLMGHDINNLNQVAMGYLELAAERLSRDEATRELIVKPWKRLKRVPGSSIR